MLLTACVHAQSETPQRGFGRNSRPAVAIAVSMPNSQVKIGADVHLQITRINISDENVVVALPNSNASEDLVLDFEIDLLDAEGNQVTQTQYGRTVQSKGGLIHGPGIGKLTGGAPHALKPKEKLQQDIVLSSLFELSRPGTYTVQLRRQDRTTESVVAKSNRITFIVTP
jgi:hypothetical protein